MLGDFIATTLAGMGPFLLTARLFTAGILVFRILNDVRAAHSSALIYLAVTIQFVGVVLVVLGYYKTRYGALALSGFCIIATSLFHADFGNHGEVEQFLLDFAIAGGLLFMFAHGPGPLSLDARRAKRSANTTLSVDGQIESDVAGVIGPA